ncbi:caltractin (centrin)-like [Cryptosporidium ryanae]|uniref:caltractin (centrin)-like n=1 Tax=Cryptosporidium ryanae TaxID=515981 RepID=UPI003519FA9F|nr:caltractin (centrin)-like [Cryptosporidium ryanae]
MSSGELSKEQREDALCVFEVFDMDQDGQLDLREFKSALRALGFEVNKEEIKLVISSCLDNSLGLSINSTTRGGVNSSYLPSSSSGSSLIGGIIDGDRILDFEDFCSIISYLMETQKKFGIGAFYGTARSENGKYSLYRKESGVESYFGVNHEEDLGDESPVSIEYVRRIFSLFDTNKTGKVGLRNLKALISQVSRESHNLNMKSTSDSGGIRDLVFTDEELSLMIKHIDRDNDGFLDFEDFYKVFQYCHGNDAGINI